MMPREKGAIDFGLCLQGVAAIDEDRRAFAQHHSDTGGSAETGQPTQPLGPLRDVFALVFVGERDDKAIETLAFQLRR
jgi:hypothetical protein